MFNQSQVAEHAELAWIFNCVARLGWLNRMTQFKEKAGKDRENASVGLYAYPSLMAADILVYRATHVPVGEDQKQHLELSRDIAQKFNNDFGRSIHEHGYGDAFFPLPEPLITGEATRVMSLRDGTKKMSKSDASDYSRINLTDDADAIAQKIRKAKTDPEPLPSEEAGLKSRPEADNLVGIYAALADTTRADVLAQFGNAQFSTFKSALVDLSVAKLGPIGAEMKRLMRDPVTIDAVLADGAARAQKLAGETMKAVKDIVGFVRVVTFAAACGALARSTRRIACRTTRRHVQHRRLPAVCSVLPPEKISMSRRRRSYEAGHKPKLLVVIDDTEECDRAVYFASRRAARIGGGVVMLRVIEMHDQSQQWLGVADIMRAEAHEEADARTQQIRRPRQRHCRHHAGARGARRRQGRGNSQVDR